MGDSKADFPKDVGEDSPLGASVPRARPHFTPSVASGPASETLLPAQPCHLVVDVQLVVLPGLQGLVQVQVTLHCVVLEDVAPA